MSLPEYHGIDHKSARFLAAVAEALEKLPDGEATYGSIYVSEVRIGHSGEDTGYRVYPDEFGGYEIAAIEPEPIPAQAQPTTPLGGLGMSAQMIETSVRNHQQQTPRSVVVRHGVAKDGRIEHYLVRHGRVFACACGEIRDAWGRVL